MNGVTAALRTKRIDRSPGRDRGEAAGQLGEVTLAFGFGFGFGFGSFPLPRSRGGIAGRRPADARVGCLPVRPFPPDPSRCGPGARNLGRYPGRHAAVMGCDGGDAAATSRLRHGGSAGPRRERAIRRGDHDAAPDRGAPPGRAERALPPRVRLESRPHGSRMCPKGGATRCWTRPSPPFASCWSTGRTSCAFASSSRGRSSSRARIPLPASTSSGFSRAACRRRSSPTCSDSSVRSGPASAGAPISGRRSPRTATSGPRRTSGSSRSSAFRSGATWRTTRPPPGSVSRSGRAASMSIRSGTGSGSGPVPTSRGGSTRAQRSTRRTSRCTRGRGGSSGHGRT